MPIINTCKRFDDCIPDPNDPTQLVETPADRKISGLPHDSSRTMRTIFTVNAYTKVYDSDGTTLMCELFSGDKVSISTEAKIGLTRPTNVMISHVWRRNKGWQRVSRNSIIGYMWYHFKNGASPDSRLLT